MPTETVSTNTLLTLAQWFSPSFPVGSFSYSHGLEWAVNSGEVTDSSSFESWLSAILADGAGRNDAILLASAFRLKDWDELGEIDALARALAPSRERLAETALQGAAFARTVSDIWPDTQASSFHNLTYPVAVGAAAQAMDLPLTDTIILFMQGFAGNLTSAAIRLIPLGQTEGQAVLAAVASLCEGIAIEAQTQTLDDLGACTFMADIASMKHETQYTRLFQS